jgi:hypothetical protein
MAGRAAPLTLCPCCPPTLYADSTYSVSVCVCPMMLPLMTETAPNSPIARCRHIRRRWGGWWLWVGVQLPGGCGAETCAGHTLCLPLMLLCSGSGRGAPAPRPPNTNITAQGLTALVRMIP